MPMSGKSYDPVLHDKFGEWAEAPFNRRPEIDRADDSVSERPAERAKVALTLKLDRDIAEHYKAIGPGWEARVETILRQAMAEGEAAPPAADQGFISDGYEG